MMAPFKPGDILGYCGYNLTSQLINLVTYGFPFNGLSHVDIIGEYDGELLCFGSTTLTDQPCHIQGKEVAGVQAHLIEDRVKAYSGKVWHYPLRNHDFEITELTDFLVGHLGAPYDYYGAYKSGGYLWSKLRGTFDEPSLTSIFCSEFCAAAHKHLGIFRTRNESHWNPNSFCRKERKELILEMPERIR